MSDSPHPQISTRAEDFPGTLRESFFIAALWFVFALIVLWFLRARVWALAGHDAYYHLRFAAHFLEQGVRTHTIPWLRLSALAEQWGDKEFLFRMFLLPFARAEDLMTGGKLALCVLNALQAAVVAFVGVRWGGRRGALLPLLILAVSLQVWYRLNLLRPHNLSLILLVLAAYLIGRRSYRGLGLLAVVYALSYTACQTLWILCAGTFVLLWLDRRERDWRILVYPALGLGLGLLVHPAFPHNLILWKLGNVDLYVHSEVLSIALETSPGSTFDMLIQSGMGLFLLGVGVFTTRPWTGAARPGRQEVVLFGFAFAFVLLYLLAYRFIEYAAAFSALYLFALYNRLAANPTHEPGVRRTRDVLMGTLVMYGVLFHVVLLRATDGVQADNPYFFESDEAMEAFAEAIPEGAHVAAPWDVTSIYCFAAPQGRYLNQLDPVFMFAADPELYPVVERLFRGLCFDLVAVVHGLLDSHYVALPKLGITARLRHQIDNDPRFAVVHDGKRHILYGMREADGFVTDWKFAMQPDPSEEVVPPPEGAYSEPMWAEDATRAWVSPPAYRDLATLPFGEFEPVIWWARRTITAAEAEGDLRVRFSARGRADIFVDGEPVVVCHGAGVLAPGQVAFRLPLSVGSPHRIEVRIAPRRVPGGFFWQQVPEPSSTEEASP